MSTPSHAGYREDLAFVHDAGFVALSQHAAPVVAELLANQGHAAGRVVELGCGSGVFADLLSNAGYDVLGIDLSAAMIALARQRAPRAEFRQGSYLAFDLPPCVAVVAIGEVFNYLFDSKNTWPRLAKLFRHVHQALEPGGLFVFDFATPGREPTGHRSGYVERDDWACMFTAVEDRDRGLLTRKITSFRRVGELYRRDEEVHRLRLYRSAQIVSELRQSGFRVHTRSGYGELRFPPGLTCVVARSARRRRKR